jgi:D-alanyl-D-alanine carboxypeptidase
MFLKPGMQVSVEDLNKGVIIQSGNDASIAIAAVAQASRPTVTISVSLIFPAFIACPTT